MITPSETVRPVMWSVSVWRKISRSSTSPNRPMPAIARPKPAQKPQPAVTQ